MSDIKIEHRPTTIILKKGDNVYIVEARGRVNTIVDVWDQLIEPVLLAAGYSEEVVPRLFNAEER